ncbi:hypothetical protein Nepgr_014858 [Nepenthes gracilis]|uniref:Uncharacterized protein n=1 Tax=Nepenthes gracilis TaxID=150966 RepID=A0AAD3XPW5_NEPGR|nr:hypothetical protein Nepgr_014858 [Nepenthes gracilis]
MTPSSSSSPLLSFSQNLVNLPHTFCPSNEDLFDSISQTFLPLPASRSALVSSQLAYSSDSKLSPLLDVQGIFPERSQIYIENAKFPLFLELGSIEERRRISVCLEGALEMINYSPSGGMDNLTCTN